ncbi:hypothetical protein QJS66_02805 [Kocuria rhizophila]|nr:hypothetical protein QJS66_02805 [Kocuria rhizophila]
MITKYDLTKATVAWALRVVCRPVVTGLDRLPETGPVIIASNDLTFLDSVIISAFMPRRVKFDRRGGVRQQPRTQGEVDARGLRVHPDHPRGPRPAERVRGGPAARGGAPAGGQGFWDLPQGTRSRDGDPTRPLRVAYLAYLTVPPRSPRV